MLNWAISLNPAATTQRSPSSPRSWEGSKRGEPGDLLPDWCVLISAQIRTGASLDGNHQKPGGTAASRASAWNPAASPGRAATGDGTAGQMARCRHQVSIWAQSPRHLQEGTPGNSSRPGSAHIPPGGRCQAQGPRPCSHMLPSAGSPCRAVSLDCPWGCGAGRLCPSLTRHCQVSSPKAAVPWDFAPATGAEQLHGKQDPWSVGVGMGTGTASGGGGHWSCPTEGQPPPALLSRALSCFSIWQRNLTKDKGHSWASQHPVRILPRPWPIPCVVRSSTLLY